METSLRVRSPSARVLINTCNIYVSISTRGADGGIKFAYPSSPTYTDVPCTIQGQATEVVDDQKRVTQLTGFVIIFAIFVTVSPRDKITFIDANGTLRTCYVESIEDMAGRAAAFKVYTTERL